VEDQARNEREKAGQAKVWPPRPLNADAVKVSRVVAECAYLTWRHEMLELFWFWRSVCARFPHESRTRYPLILTIQAQPAINLVRLGRMLFAFKRGAPIASTLPPRHYATKSTTPGQWLCTNEG
jgi:hypothetical protein